MRIKRNVFILFTATIFMLASVSSVFANEGDNTITLDSSEYTSDEKLQQDIEQYLSDANVDEVIVLSENESIENDTLLHQQPSSMVSPYTTSPVYYQVKNVATKANQTGSTSLATAKGTPGITVSITQTKSVSTTLSSNFGASNSLISSAVGWSVTGSTSISIGGSAKVPSKHNNKSVKTMTLHAKPVYKVKTFDVYRVATGYTTQKVGTGTTKKAKGVSFTKTYVYK